MCLHTWTCFYFGLEQDWKSSGGWRVSFAAIQLTIRERQSEEGDLGKTKYLTAFIDDENS